MNFENEDSNRARRDVGTRLAVGGMLLLAFVGAAVILYGCGSGSSESASSSESEASTGSLAAVQASAPVETVPVAVAAPAIVTDGGSAMPPEIALESMDTLVIPGQAITVSVQATPDVQQILLSDGINDPQAMVRDASGNGTWHVDYRVPLRPRDERFGLSVTAKNETGRWRRLWLFLTVQTPGMAVEADPDSIRDEK